MATVNRDRFLRGEGLQLMNLMLREKKMSRNGSLKVYQNYVDGRSYMCLILNPILCN